VFSFCFRHKFLLPLVVKSGPSLFSQGPFSSSPVPFSSSLGPFSSSPVPFYWVRLFPSRPDLFMLNVALFQTERWVHTINHLASLGPPFNIKRPPFNEWIFILWMFSLILPRSWLWNPMKTTSASLLIILKSFSSLSSNIPSVPELNDQWKAFSLIVPSILSTGFEIILLSWLQTTYAKSTTLIMAAIQVIPIINLILDWQEIHIVIAQSFLT